MDLEDKYFQTMIYMKAGMYKATLMVKADINGKMVQFMKANLYKVLGKVKVP